MTRIHCDRLAAVMCLFAALPLLSCSSANDLGAWPTQLLVRSPASQTGLVGFPVNAAPAVELTDSKGDPIAGATITFAVTSGGGTLTGASAVTDKNGIATVGSWTIASGTGTVTASIPSVFHVAPATFAATAVTSTYHIDLAFLTPVSPSRQAVFDSAAARWERIVYGDLSDIPVNIPADLCFTGQPALNTTIDDLWIYVVLDSIDGPGNILGESGPCLIRSSNKLSLLGEMIFDTADVALLESNGAFDDVILHEMGHVVGYGVLWDIVPGNLLVGPASQGGTDPHFDGPLAIAAFDQVGGTGYTGGAKVPVEAGGGPGTEDAHWRESVFHTELMTGYLNLGVPNPLSVVTIASMGDMGYQVNYGAADQYGLPSAAAPPAVPGRLFGTIALGNDIVQRPIHLVDRQGRLVGLYRR